MQNCRLQKALQRMRGENANDVDLSMRRWTMSGSMSSARNRQGFDHANVCTKVAFVGLLSNTATAGLLQDELTSHECGTAV